MRTPAAASEMRQRIIRAASEIIQSDGFGAVNAQRLADMIGLRRPIIYYYFDDVDEILIEAVRLAYVETRDAALRARAESATQRLWQMFTTAAAPLAEFTALALRTERFRSVYVEIMTDLRLTFTNAIAQEGRRPGEAHGGLDAEGLSLLIQIVSIGLATEHRMGLDKGHDQLREFMRGLLAPGT